ncbi:hypothetical protein C8Q74DRAFT_1367945 [Fomes fomentarius]|nr:hypothetical protein C8Q74DRAFT_1367945 [Fomes fomentarius]
MDPFDNVSTIVGSRRPILIPAVQDLPSSLSHLPAPSSYVPLQTLYVAASRSRRKPANVFKSPAADEPGEWEGSNSVTRKRASPPYQRVSPRRASSSTDRSQSSSNNSSAPLKAVQRNPPLLPLYHPLGPLALSLPKLDPGLFGLPSSLSIDDVEEQVDGEPGQPSRARRRGDEDDAQSTGTPNGTVQEAPAKERNSSPRKRRGGGAKRKRKDADDADGVFPPPPKRTRNPRGAANNSTPAAPSPLVGPAVVASDLVDDVAENNGEVEGEAQEELQAPKRPSRTRKPRTKPAKRRDSSGSASTTTSASVPIEAAAKATVEAKAAGLTQAEDEAQIHEEGVNGIDGLVRREEEETEDTPQAMEETRSPAGVDVPALTPAHAVVRDVPEARNGPTKAIKSIPAPPSPRPMAPLAAPAPPPPHPQTFTVPVSQKEEREEGELSD